MFINGVTSQFCKNELGLNFNMVSELVDSRVTYLSMHQTEECRVWEGVYGKTQVSHQINKTIDKSL